MTTLHYLAYGSNLYPPRLAARIPIVAVVGVVELPGWALAFNKRGSDGSAKCNLHCRDGALAYGVIYRIAAVDRATLDRIEGAGRGYDVDALTLAPHGECCFYRATADAIDESLRPFDWYRAYVLAGARHHALPQCYLDQIAAVLTVIDSDARRRAENFARIA